jgi:hypothetical protein
VRARTIAIVAGVGGGLGWLGKIAIMAAQGGPDPDSIPEALAFFVGLLGIVVAAAAVGVHLSRGRPLVWRVGAAVGCVVAVAAVTFAGQAALGALPGDAWLREEAMLGVVGLVALVLSLAALGRSRRAAAPTA